MLRVRFTTALVGILGVAWALIGAPTAWGDDIVTADNDWIHGRSEETHEGSDARKRPTPPRAPEAKDDKPYYSPSDCLRPVGAGAAVRCERDPAEPGDLTAIREFTPPTEAEVRVVLRLPDPTPRFGPDPSVNEWKMLAVGYPIWLWTDKPTTLEATATHDGLTMTLTAERTSTSFDLGDGHHLTCTRTTEYPARPDRYGTPSPTCGYTYQKRSRPGHDYTVTATTHWQITWTTAGRTGTLTTTHTGHRTLPIGELQALIRG